MLMDGRMDECMTNPLHIGSEAVYLLSTHQSSAMVPLLWWDNREVRIRNQLQPL
jgi:hypothetical protein